MAGIAVNPSLLGTLKASQDNYITSQKAQLGASRDATVNKINSGFDDNMLTENNNKTDATNQYNTTYKGLVKQNNLDSQVTNLTAYNNGIQNSQQMLGLMQGDQARFKDNTVTAQTTRDQAINQINSRISNLTKQKNADMLTATNTFNAGMVGATADAQKQYNDSLFQLQQQALQQQQAQALAQQQARALAVQRAKTMDASNLSSGARASAVQGASNLASQYGQYKTTSHNTALDHYNQKETQLFTGSVVRNTPVIPPPSLSANQGLSDWQKYRIMTGQGI